MQRRIIKTLLALVLAAGAIATVTANGASATPLSDAAAGWAYLPASSGTPLASGVLSVKAGAPIAGATLVLSAEPTDGSTSRGPHPPRPAAGR